LSLALATLALPAGAADQDDQPNLDPGKKDELPFPRRKALSFGCRTDKERRKLLEQEGGNDKSEAAVAAGLEWLARHQNADGSWNAAEIHKDGKCNCDGPGRDDRIAGTALALLPFLGAGQTSKGGVDQPAYAKQVDRAVKYLIGKQKDDGALSDNGYVQAIATIALCEAYGMTKEPGLKGPAQKAIEAIVAWQGPDGGFRYAPKEKGDTSVTSWHLQALKAGQLAGLTIPDATLRATYDFLDKVSTDDGGGVGYLDNKPTLRMTAAGMFCRTAMGWGPRHPGLVRGVETLRKTPPSPKVKDMYYYYYATRVLFEMEGEAWERWNDKMRDLLIDNQDQGMNPERRDQKGSWDPGDDPYGQQLGRLGVTSLAILTLEVYYRYEPFAKRLRLAK
jgi:hypothetical protein